MNTVYIIAPALTLRTSPEADAFLEATHRTLQEFVSTPILRTVSQLLITEPDAGDAVVFFNREDAHYLEGLTRFVQKASRAGASTLPVAVSTASRRPPEVVADCQSFDLIEQLRQRALVPRQAATVANVFARQVLSILKPTLVTEPMRLFLSHRRFDGEDLAAAFNRLRTTSTARAFRDLFEIRVGEDAQEVIDARLSESDAVIFLDTPKAGESPWIAKELRAALHYGLPIVWVRVGAERGRVPPEVQPAGAPHFVLSDIDPATQQIPPTLVEQIVHKAAQIHHRDYVDRLFSELGRLQDIAAHHGITLMQIDARHMVYCLTLPRRQERYRERPLRHLLQLFGRTPTKQDIGEFAGRAQAGGYESHPTHGPHYDSAILLAAIPPRTAAGFDDCGVHTDSIGDYVNEIERVTKSRQQGRKRIVLSGAFADCEPEFQQNMTSAVHAMAEAALKLGSGLSFGAHPTFQFMIFDLAKRLRPEDFRNALRMYVSRYFVTESVIGELQQSAVVIPTDTVRGDRGASLTSMRRAMLSDPEAGALVVIGGKRRRGVHVPGIDEEIAIAREMRLPVFVIGSVGGRSSEIVAAMSAAESIALNGHSEAVNEAFATGQDYSRLAHIVVKATRQGGD